MKDPSPTKVLRGHNGNMVSVAYPTLEHVISASEDRTIRRFRVSDGHSEVLKEGVVCVTATSPNGQWMALGGTDGRVRLFHLNTPSTVARSVERHAHVIKSLAFSPDSTQLASGAMDGSMYLWSSPALERVAGPFGGHKDAVWCICYSPDGNRVATCDRESIQIWETDTRIGVTIAEQAWSLAWSPESDILFAGCIDGSIRRCDPNTAQLLSSHKEHTDVVSSIVLSRNTRFIVTASWDRTVRFYEVVTFQQIGPTLKHNAQLHSVALSPDDSFLVSGARDHLVRTWDLRTIAPALFRPLPLEPVRSQQTPRRWPTRSSGHGVDTDDSPPDDSHSSRGSDIDHGSSDNKSNKSENSKRFPSRLRIPTLRRKGTRASASSTQEGSHTGSSSSITDKISIGFFSPRQPVDDPAVGRTIPSCSDIQPSPQVSPVNSVVLPVSPAPIPITDSENRSFIQKCRSEPEHDLSGKIIAEGTYPVTGGSHGDIYRGTLHMNGKTMRVAIKAIKHYLIDDHELSKQRRLRREVELWLKLEHENVLPLLGITKNYGEYPAMVCPWAENGQLLSYIRAYHDTLTAQRRWGLINDVALGLQYLHSQNIVHGDISGGNVLVYDSGRACISDFGLSIAATPENSLASFALTYQVKGTLCWTAPELMSLPENEEEEQQVIFPTVKSDMYSFGGIMLLILSGQRPYHYLSDQQAITTIAQGKLPRRPSASIVTDDQWEFMMKCWSFVPADRPSDADTVHFAHNQLLNAVAGSSESTRL